MAGATGATSAGAGTVTWMVGAGAGVAAGVEVSQALNANAMPSAARINNRRKIGTPRWSHDPNAAQSVRSVCGAEMVAMTAGFVNSV